MLFIREKCDFFLEIDLFSILKKKLMINFSTTKWEKREFLKKKRFENVCHTYKPQVTATVSEKRIISRNRVPHERSDGHEDNKNKNQHILSNLQWVHFGQKRPSTESMLWEKNKNIRSIFCNFGSKKANCGYFGPKLKKNARNNFLNFLNYLHNFI